MRFKCLRRSLATAFDSITVKIIIRRECDSREALRTKGEDDGNSIEHGRSTSASRRRASVASLAEVGPLSQRAAVGTVRRTTARMEMPGTTSVMTRPDPAPITGARTVWRDSPTTNSIFALRSRCGTAATRY